MRLYLQTRTRLGGIIGLWALAGCAVAPQHQAAQTASPPPTEPIPYLGQDYIAPLKAPVSDNRTELQYHVLAAEMAAQRGVLVTAAGEYFKAAELSSSPALAERATRIALATADDDLALRAARRWVEVDPKAIPPREIVVRQSLRSGNTQEAFEQSQLIVDLHPKGGNEGLREVALVLSGDSAHTDAALGVMQRLVDKYSKNAHAHYALGLLAIRFGKFEVALEQANQAIKLDGAWEDAYLLKAGTLIKMGNFDKAKSVIERIAAKKPGNTQIRLAYARLLIESEQLQAAAVEYRQVLQEDSGNPEALFALGLLSLNAQDFDEAYRNIRALYGTGDRREDAAWYLGQIEERRGHLREAYDWYGQVGDGSQSFAALARRAFVLYKLEGLDSARRYLAGLRAGNPDMEVRLYEVEGELLYDSGRYAEALQMYDSALASNPDDAVLVYGRAMAEAELDQFENAERDFRKILEQKPDDARSLNALGYLLANHTQRFQEALGYINLALKLTPDDASVIDSMGWVQYRLGNLDEALTYLQDAFRRQPDPEIAAHLGEVLWQLGRQDKAKAVWKEALAQNPDHRVLRETVSRLNK